MTIISGKYPEADPAKWVRFKHLEQADVEPVFLRRFAAMCHDAGVVGVIAAGYRSEQCQRDTAKQILASTPGAYQISNGAVYNKKGQCIVAAPGNSNHNYRIALDCETEKIKAYSNATFEKYGLRRPMAHEPWHIEPIESYGMSKEEKIKIRDSYREVKNVDIKGLQTAGKAIGVYNKTIDGTNGPGTKAAAEEFLPVVLQVLGLQDPRKLQDENVKLREKLNNIRAQATL